MPHIPLHRGFFGVLRATTAPAPVAPVPAAKAPADAAIHQAPRALSFLRSTHPRSSPMKRIVLLQLLAAFTVGSSTAFADPPQTPQQKALVHPTTPTPSPQPPPKPQSGGENRAPAALRATQSS